MSEETPLTRSGTVKALWRAVTETPALRTGLGLTVAFAAVVTLAPSSHSGRYGTDDERQFQ